MRDKFSALSGVGLAAMVVAGLAMPIQAQAKTSRHTRHATHKAAGTVTLTKEQWEDIQAKLNQVDSLNQKVDQLEAAQQTTQTQASAAQTTASQAQTVATQAQSTATLAQNTASKAQTTAEGATKTAKDLFNPLAGLKDTKISGRMYYNISTDDHKVNGSKTEDDGGLQIKRFYVGIDHKFNSVLSGDITTDVKEIGGVGQALYIKKAYLSAKFSPAFEVRVGSTDLPWIPYAEGIYGYRYVENTLIDREGFGTSADWGVHVMGSLGGGIVSYEVSAIDGGGYRNPQFTKTVDLEGRVSLQYMGFNAAVGGYTGKLGKDDTVGVTPPHTASRFDALLAYKNKLFTAGGEYFYAKNWTQVTSATEDKADGWSLFGDITPIPKFSAFARYDWVKPHKDTRPDYKDQYFNGGVQYEAFKNVKFALVYKHDKLEDTAIAGLPDSVDYKSTDDQFGLWGQFQW